MSLPVAACADESDQAILTETTTTSAGQPVQTSEQPIDPTTTSQPESHQDLGDIRVQIHSLVDEHVLWAAVAVDAASGSRQKDLEAAFAQLSSTEEKLGRAIPLTGAEGAESAIGSWNKYGDAVRALIKTAIPKAEPTATSGPTTSTAAQEPSPEAKLTAATSALVGAMAELDPAIAEKKGELLEALESQNDVIEAMVAASSADTTTNYLEPVLSGSNVVIATILASSGSHAAGDTRDLTSATTNSRVLLGDQLRRSALLTAATATATLDGRAEDVAVAQALVSGSAERTQALLEDAGVTDPAATVAALRSIHSSGAALASALATKDAPGAKKANEDLVALSRRLAASLDTIADPGGEADESLAESLESGATRLTESLHEAIETRNDGSIIISYAAVDDFVKSAAALGELVIVGSLGVPVR